MTERLVRVETKLDLLITNMEPRHVDHEARLRRLEARVYVASGVALGGGGLLGALISHLTGGAV